MIRHIAIGLFAVMLATAGSTMDSSAFPGGFHRGGFHRGVVVRRGPFIGRRAFGFRRRGPVFGRGFVGPRRGIVRRRWW